MKRIKTLYFLDYSDKLPIFAADYYKPIILMMMNKKLTPQSVCVALTLLMMFCFSIPANAQIGGLLKKAKNVIKDTPKEIDAAESNIRLNKETRENELGIGTKNQSTTATTSNLNKIYEGTSRDDSHVIATWNPDTQQFTLVKTFADGDLAGQPMVYTVNESTGEVTRNDGKLMATIKGDDIIFPEIGTLAINTKTGGGLSLNGKSIGKVTRTEAYCYGKQFGSFRKEATRQLVAFFLFNEYATKEEVSKLKTAMDARDKASAEGMANFKANMKKITAGNFQNAAGTKIGSITANGKVLNRLGEQIGVIQASGKITDAYNRDLGRFTENGEVYKGNTWCGKIQANGAVEDPRKTPSGIGRIQGNDFYDASSNRIARFTGEGRYVAAVCYFFFFSFK